MQEAFSIKDWDDLQHVLAGFHRLSLRDQKRFLFRGQARSTWPLDTSLDRALKLQRTPNRTALAERLIAEFKMQSAGLHAALGRPEEPIEWELLARHHGLPTSVIDWTRSPYIAAFFACEDAVANEPFSIYMFDCLYFEERVMARGDDPIKILDEYEYIALNSRAIEQHAVAMQVVDAGRGLTEVLGKWLYRYDISGSQRADFMRRLHSMRITSRTLFRSLDHAARTAHWIASVEESSV